MIKGDLRSEKSSVNYNKIGDKTNRSDINLINRNDSNFFINDKEEDVKRKENDRKIVAEQYKLQNLMTTKNLNKGKPIYLDNKPYVLQNPQLQIYGHMNNNAVCPFCKYTGTMEIEFKRSTYQSKLCAAIATFGGILCCWIPYYIKALSDQVYKCNSCKKILKTVPHGEI